MERERKIRNMKDFDLYATHPLIVILIGAIIGFILVLVFNIAVDIKIQNQDIMLCESAKISGNVQYLYKCECYYKGEPIKCLQK